MARILVRIPKNKIRKYRLWCTTVDSWVSAAMDKDTMTVELMDNWEHSFAEASDRIDRKDYEKDHCKNLEEWYDNNQGSLNYMHRKNRLLPCD